MANTTDMSLNGLNGDLLIKNGDLVFNLNSLNQNIADILVSVPGDWQQYPNVGCSLNLYYDSQINGLQSIVKKQLISDGINIDYINIYIDENSVLQADITGNRP